MARRSLLRLYKDEFTGYNITKFRQDALAGLTVAAVALPLALAFGVSSGASASAGLVTAVISGLVIGAFSGAPYQISGPTGAMSAVLIMVAQRYGLPGLWMAGLLAGVMLLVIGLARLGRFIAFIPSPVITGFTSGIALIIFIGQIDNLLGIKTPGTEAALFKFTGYFKGGYTPDLHTLILGLVVIMTMVFWPKKWNARFPSSLLGIILATALNALVKWPVAVIGEIPRSLLLADRLTIANIPWSNMTDFLAPAFTITALGAVESLLCGAVAANMTGIRMQANQELIAQGIGNIVIPFFGGVPATAAIARSSVGIKSGGQTRMVSFIHAIGILVSMVLLSGVIAKVPLAALAGVLMVTAWRMNEWEGIRFMFRRHFKTATITFLITMLATITLDLTQAILIGAGLSALIFLNKISGISIDVQQVDPEKLRTRGIENLDSCDHVRVAFLTGPLFFAATGHFHEAFDNLGDTHALILSMRGVPMIDTSGLESLKQLCERMHKRNAVVMFAGVHENVMQMMRRGNLVDDIGEQNFFWSSDQAIVAAQTHQCAYCD